MRRYWWWDYVLIFAAGSIWDSILSLDTIWTAHFSYIGAFGSTITVTMLSYFMYDKIREEAGINWPKAWTLALGSGFGASLTTWWMGP